MKKKKEKRIWRLAFKGYLEDNEEVLYVVHKHPILHGKRFGQAFFFGLFIPFVLWFLFPKITPFAILWASIGIVRLVGEIVVWYYEVWLITNLSIIDIDQEGFFSRSSTRLEYHHIETTTYEIKGVSPTVFNYGDLIIEKTTGNNITFKGVFAPKKVIKILNTHQDHFAQSRVYRDHNQLKSLLTDMIHTHSSKKETNT